MGLIMASWGLGPALAAVVVSLLLEGMGWQNGFIALGVGSAAIMFVLIGLFRDTPADKGIQPYGYRPGDAEVKKRKPDPEKTKIYNRHMRKNRRLLEYEHHSLLGVCGTRDHLGLHRTACGQRGADTRRGGERTHSPVGGQHHNSHYSANHVRLCWHKDRDVHILRGAGHPGGDAVLDTRPMDVSTCLR